MGGDGDAASCEAAGTSQVADPPSAPSQLDAFEAFQKEIIACLADAIMKKMLATTLTARDLMKLKASDDQTQV